jgi:hypothetical protein
VGLLGPNGQPISTNSVQTFKKANPPKLGEAFGRWAGEDISYLSLPGGGVLGFDLNQLTLADYRTMTNHYQIHSSLAVLSFMQHQADWHIECEDKRIRDHCQANMEEIWTSLSRALSTANWSGFSPNVLQWENDTYGRTVQLAKVKDLVPEDCYVHWKEVKGYAPPGKMPPKMKIYDGIDQWGSPYTIPVEASVWYPLLMENGNYYGKKLLKPAFTSWYFSLLLHVFANRYYERFGEPVPVGRAPMDEDVVFSNGLDAEGNVKTQTLGSRDYMLQMLQNIRSRSAVVLPGDKNTDDMGAGTGSRDYEYDIEYLESQMRGADFERYMTRLDEEMSIGLFTPILLMRTADVGSYNLGVGHMQMYLWMLNAMNGDRKHYIDKYVLSRMVDFNFSPNAPRAKIKFRKLGNTNIETLRAVLVEVLRKGGAGVDLTELGQLVGMTLHEIREVTKPAPAPGDDDTDDEVPGEDPNGGRDPDKETPGGGGSPKDTVANMKERIRGQARKGFANGTWKPDLGYRKQLQQAFHQQGHDPSRADAFFGRMDQVMRDMSSVTWKGGADEFMQVFEPMIDSQLEAVLAS